MRNDYESGRVTGGGWGRGSKERSGRPGVSLDSIAVEEVGPPLRFEDPKGGTSHDETLRVPSPWTFPNPPSKSLGLPRLWAVARTLPN